MSEACKMYVKVLSTACMKRGCKPHVEVEMKRVSKTHVLKTIAKELCK